MNRKNGWILWGFLAFATLLAGCQKEKDPLTVTLEGRWAVVELWDGDQVFKDENAFMQIDSNDSMLFITGNSGVNMFNGDAKFSKSGLFDTEDLSHTEMASEDPAKNEFESLFLKVLWEADSYEISENLLVIRNAQENQEIRLEKVTQ